MTRHAYIHTSYIEFDPVTLNLINESFYAARRGNDDDTQSGCALFLGNFVVGAYHHHQYRPHHHPWVK